MGGQFFKYSPGFSGSIGALVSSGSIGAAVFSAAFLMMLISRLFAINLEGLVQKFGAALCDGIIVFLEPGVVHISLG